MRMRLAAGGEEGAFVEYMDRLTELNVEMDAYLLRPILANLNSRLHYCRPGQVQHDVHGAVRHCDR